MRPIAEDAYRAGDAAHDIEFRAGQMDALSRGLSGAEQRARAEEAGRLLRDAAAIIAGLARELAGAADRGGEL